MRRPRAFCEFPAGLAAVSLRLHGGPKCRPPISRMGNKAGYAQVILAALGLRSGQGAGAYVWAEADDDVRGLLRAYPDAALLHRIAAIIRGWADEEPRALWERLRAERRARGPREASDADTAAWMFISGNAYAGGDGWKPVPVARPNTDANLSVDGLSDACAHLANYAMIAASNRLINVAGPDLMNTGNGGTRFGGPDFATPAPEVAGRFEEVAAEVAGWSIGMVWSVGATGNIAGFCGPGHVSASGKIPFPSGTTTADDVADRFEHRSDYVGWPPVAILPRIPTAASVAAWLGTPGDLDGVIVYSDPPYLGTTGYRHELGRDEVIAIARDFAALGAVVCISEAEPIDALGWEAVEITGGRVGQIRTFSRQKREWLTMNRAPAHRIATQHALFGGAA